MKKITFLLFCLMIMTQVKAQTLNDNANWPNAAWTLTGTDAGETNPDILEGNPTTTDANFAFDDDDAGSGVDNDIAAESPIIDLTAAFNAGETWLTVSGDYVYRYLANDALLFEYWDADGATWLAWGPEFDAGTAGAPTNDYCAATPESFTTVILDISGFSATQLSGFRYRISYNDDPAGADYNYGFCFQSPTITSEAPPACIDPTDLTAVNITDTTAELAWTPGNTETLWNIEIVNITAGGTFTGTPTNIGVSNPYVATGLIPDNDYEYYVQADCSVDGTSNWVGPFALRTACAAVIAPYTETFETFTVAGSSFLSENCWTANESADSYNWEVAATTDTSSGGTGPGSGVSDGNYLFTEATGPAAGAVTELFSPLVDLTALTDPSVSFDYHMFGVNMGTLEVLVNGNLEFSVSGEQQLEDDPFLTQIIDLSAYAGSIVQVTFRATRGPDFESDIAIDTVVFDEAPSCFTPTNLDAANITDTTADLSWTAGGSETLWNIEIVDITAGGTPTGTPTDTGVTNPYTVTGLTEVTDYEYYVQADCGADGVSEWFGPFAFTTIESCPTPSDPTAANITNTDADLSWTENGAATSWNIEIVDITAGGSATGTATDTGVTNPYTVSGLAANNDYEYYVQADCGVDGVSQWAGPFAFRTACDVFAAPYTETFETFTVAGSSFLSENCWSANESADSYNWEVAATTDTSSGGTGPGPGVSDGNYLFTEATGPGAGAITELFSPLVDLTALTDPSVSFDYHMFGGDMGTLDVLVNGNLEFSVSGQQQLENDPFLTGIIDLSAYAGSVVQVTFRATRGPDFESDIAIDTVVFGEAPSCFNPSGLTAANITDTSADLSWTAEGSETSWNIELVDVTAGGTATGTATDSGVTNPYTLSGLTENNNYEYYVQADCGVDGVSEWVGPFAFSTLETCPAPSALTASNITETSADLSWTENGASTSWNIEIVDITAGGTATGTATVTGVSNPYTASGLAGDNIYEYYVQADCGVDGVSAWAGPFSFSTTYVPVPADCTTGIFLDTGGNSGTYSDDESYTTTIFPDAAGNTVTITFTYVDIEASTGTGSQDGCWDFLTIYNGPDNTFPVLAQTLCGEESGDGDVPSVGTSELNIGDSFTSTDPSGALTVEFNSDSSVSETGWAASVTCASLSVDDLDNPNMFTYYPNPVKDDLVLHSENEISNVTVMNLLGQNVLTSTPNSTDSTIDMSGLQAGAYFVKVTVGNATKTIRVIKD
ncbi:MAG: T9SS type A sorting domain-containing protein [Algicola sp.]|nr:T9SS type A sorting domain-containing protein [Algicola sp.]